MDTAGVIRRVQRIFGDSASVQITPLDIIDWINEAQLRIVRETDCLLAEVPFNSVAGVTGPFTLPADFVRVKRVSYNGIKLVETQRESIEDFVFDAQKQGTIGSLYYYVEGNKLWLYPGPDLTLTAGIKLLYTQAPVELVSQSDPLSLPLINHEAITRFCLMRANELNENEPAVKRLEDDVFSQIGSSIQDQTQQSDSYPVIRDYVGDYW